MVDDGQAIAQLVHLGHVVRGQQDGPARHRLLPALHQFAHGARGGDVEAERWLVQEEDPWVVEQAPREVQLLALTGRQ